MAGLLCLVAAGAAVVWSRRETRKTMETLDRMISFAMEGRFQETTFDESRLSALETKFAQYLSASAVSARAVAVEKDRIKTLISDISHQTKTPLSNLLLYTELLGEEALPESAQREVEMLRAQTEKLRFFIDALVKLSRLESGIIALTPKAERLEPVLRGVAEQFAPKAQAKGLTVQREETELCAVFDAKWTAEVLCNLLDNAVKYTQEGGIQISVKPYEMFVCVEITDTGIGIPEAEQAQIFSRFYRGEEASEQEGVGIGLYLAREILSGEGGYLKVRSRTGEGSTFGVYLPRSEGIFQNC